MELGFGNEIRPSFLASNYDFKCHNQSKFILLSVSKFQKIYPYLFFILIRLQIGCSKQDSECIFTWFGAWATRQPNRRCLADFFRIIFTRSPKRVSEKRLHPLRVPRLFYTRSTLHTCGLLNNLESSLDWPIRLFLAKYWHAPTKVSQYVFPGTVWLVSVESSLLQSGHLNSHFAYSS